MGQSKEKPGENYGDKESFEEMYKHLPHPPEYPHEHQFTIPVEWRYIGNGRIGDHYHHVSRQVTKLRCPCGGETTR